MHALVDASSGIPISYIITLANIADMDIAETLIRKMMDDYDEEIHHKYSAPFRGTPAFEKLYDQRISIECTFGDLQDNYNLDNIWVTKMKRVKVFMDLSCIALLASRLSDAANKDNTMMA